MSTDHAGRPAGRRPRRPLALAAAVALAAASATTVAARASDPSSCRADWTMYQHDSARSGAVCAGADVISPANASTLAYRWFTPTAGTVTASPDVVRGVATPTGSHDVVYVGDGAGTFYALDAATGSTLWTYDVTTSDHHQPSYGEIVSTALYSADPALGGVPTVFFGGGGSVYALDARTGARRWAVDTDPAKPTSPMEVESSPVLDLAGPVPELLVGTDVNESTGQDAAGLLALNALTGAPLWRYDPGTERLLGPDKALVQQNYPSGDGCGDVWSSPALTPGGDVVFATGNCSAPQQAPPNVKVLKEAVWALSARTGEVHWVFPQPASAYGGDDDFGASPVVTSVNGTPAVIAANKSGYVYALDASTATPPAGAGFPAPRLLWSTQAAEPGQSGDAAAGAIGGFIGSGAVGPAGGANAFFGTSAIPLPFAGDGFTSSSGPQPDAGLAGDPTRAASLHALDAATGKVVWQQPLETASYAPTTYAGGVVFAPATTSFAAEAYDAATGRPLWAAPTGGAPSSGVAVVGPDVFYGAGTSFQSGSTVPPQPTGVWSFGLAGSAAPGLG